MKIIKENKRKDESKNIYSFIDASIADSYQDEEGICVKKYKADIVAELDGTEVHFGDILDFKEAGKFRVIKLKPCFDDYCPIRAIGKYCSLKKKAFFCEKIE